MRPRPRERLPRALPQGNGRQGLEPCRPSAVDQTETGFRSDEPAALQKVVVSVDVWPFLVAVSSIGRQVLPSARVLGGATGLAATTVAGVDEGAVGSAVVVVGTLGSATEA